MDNKDLETCTYGNTTPYSFDGHTCLAKCVKVYDGDTITVVFKWSNTFHRFNIRMDGYDAPELRPTCNDSKKEVEKAWAIKSRDYLRSLILDRIVTIKCGKFDKYGRILATVMLGGECINDKMLLNGYCRKYNGGRKEAWDFSIYER
jgi:endonuclease YncB( thermonuclease family)